MLVWIRGVFSNPAVQSAVKVTFIMAFASTAISSVIGIAAGLWLQKHNFLGKRVIIRINRTLMGVPPVVIGLLVYLLTMRGGPLGPVSPFYGQGNDSCPGDDHHTDHQRHGLFVC